MVNGGNPHPLGQVTPQYRRADYGQAQLGPPSLQEGELLDQVLALPIGILPSPTDIGHLIEQALEVLLSHVLSLACICELALLKGNLSSELVSLFVNRGQRGSALCLCLQHLFLGLPLG
jgi:hypothetical protein